jgi:hypothetical protein
MRTNTPCILAIVAALALPAYASAPRGGVAQCGLVLKKLDFSVPPSYSSDPTLYIDLQRLNDDVARVLNLLTDPTAADPATWCPAVGDVLALASGSTAYFSSVTPNPARDDFVQDWVRVAQLAGCR